MEGIVHQHEADNHYFGEANVLFSVMTCYHATAYYMLVHTVVSIDVIQYRVDCVFEFRIVQRCYFVVNLNLFID